MTTAVGPRQRRLEAATVIRLYYGFQLFFSLLLWVPIFYEFQRRIGLSDPEIFRIQSVYYVAFCLLEIPTGLAADSWGYLKCLRLGSVALVFANFLPVISVETVALRGSLILVHFLLIALARSFISGASSAYLYEYLARNGERARYKRVEGNARAYGLVAKVVCWAAMGSAMAWHLTLPYWLTAVSAAISVVFAWRLPDVRAASRRAGDRRAGTSAAELAGVFRLLARSPLLVLVMVQGVGVFVLARICQVNLFQPILAEKGFGLASYGWVMSITSVFEAVGAAYPGWVRKFLSDLNAVFILSVVLAASLLWIAWSGKPGTWAGLSLFAFATGLSYPIQRQLLNDVIPDAAYRATLLSVESILDRAVCAGVALALGGYVASGRVDNFLELSAGATVAAMLALALGIRLLRPISLARAGRSFIA